MAMDERLLEILLCPRCRGPLEYKDRRKVLVCVEDAIQYPVVDGIPVMLEEEASPTRTRPRKKKK